MNERIEHAVAKVKKRRVSSIWLVPIVAVALAVYLLWKNVANRGPEITITFAVGDGVTAGQTQLKHKAVAIGTVDDVSLSPDMKRVVVKVRVDRSAKPLLTDRARFWVVRPRITSLAGLTTGLETLVSGTYIQIDPGEPGGGGEGKERREFAGLDQPPPVPPDEPGTAFELVTDRLGSLSTGAPVYFRDVAVGEVTTYDVTGTGPHPVTLHVFVRAPYDRLVHDRTLFWNASGLTAQMTGAGFHVEVESLHSLLSGAIAFHTPGDSNGPPPARFTLYDDRGAADAAAFTARAPCVAYFASSVSGLGPGAAVDLLGVRIGTVTDVKLVPSGSHWLARVGFDVEPERAHIPLDKEAIRRDRLRASVETSSIVAGTKSLSLAPATGSAEYGEENGALVVPGEGGGGLDGITSSLAHVASRLETIPFDDIGKHLDATARSLDERVSSPELREAIARLADALGEVESLARDVHQGATPALARLPAIAEQLESAATKANEAFGSGGYGRDSEFQRNAQRTLKQVSDAARSIRVLSDFLDRHPESVLKGRQDPGGAR